MNTVLSVASLNELAKQVLEERLGVVSVAGEVRSLARPASGHLYFQLKDDRAEVRCALFRGNAARLGFALENGDAVIVHGSVTLYTARGDYQIVVNRVELAGDGRLAALFEALKKKLLAEGLFDAARKRSLPAWPRRVLVITSATGAALHDVEVTLIRRLPWLQIHLLPVAVQGETAAAELTAAVGSIQPDSADVVLLVRGGGSMSDLWPFNDEALARAIVACPVPIISGVGHEIDFSISDFVADVRAATPTAAAELATPITLSSLRSRTEALMHRLEQRHQAHWRALSQRVDEYSLRLNRVVRHGMSPVAARRLIRAQAALPAAARQLMQTPRQRLAALERRLHNAHPRRALVAQQQRNARLHTRLTLALSRHLAARHQRAIRLLDRLEPARWQPRWHGLTQQIAARHQQHLARLRQHLAQQRQRVAALAAMLDALAPTRVLDRGYTVVQLADGHVPSGTELQAALNTAAPVALTLRFADRPVGLDAFPQE